MNKNTKIILAILGSTLLLCIGLMLGFIRFADWQNRRNLEQMFIREPALIAQIAATMADYDLPPQYEEALVSKLLTTNVLYIFAREDVQDHLNYPRITLVQFPPDKYDDAQAAREDMRQADPQTEIEDGEIISMEAVITTIRGQKVELTIFHWVDHDGVKRRSQVSDLFEGKEGFLQLAIEGPLQGWNEEMIDAFIASMR